MNGRQFKTKVENLMRRSHPDASIAFDWEHCAKVKWFDGTSGYSGVILIQAPGYRTRRMVASLSHGELDVR